MLNNNYNFNKNLNAQTTNKVKRKNITKNKDFDIVDNELRKYKGSSKTVVIPNNVKILKYKCFCKN